MTQVPAVGFGLLTVVSKQLGDRLRRDLSTYASRAYPTCRSTLNSEALAEIRQGSADPKLSLDRFVPPSEPAGTQKDGVYPNISPKASAGLFRVDKDRWLIATNDQARLEHLDEVFRFPFDDLNHLCYMLKTQRASRPEADIVEEYLAHEQRRTSPSAQPIQKPAVAYVDLSA
ncbi:MAG: hypothetical protein R2857_06295 [Vampirovibrionales bacterium]